MARPGGGELPGLLPAPPTVSSRETWQGIAVEHHRQPPFETPEHSLLQHLVTVQLGEPVRAETRIDGRLRKWRWVQGHVSVVPARLSNKESWDRTTEYVAVRLEPGFVVQAADRSSEARDIELVPTFGARDPFVQHILLALLAEARAVGGADRLYAEAVATALSAHLLKHYAASEGSPVDGATGNLARSELRRVTEYIEEYLVRNPSLTELAEEVGMNRYRFSRLFKRSTGLSPHQYVIARRVEKAKRLLGLEGSSLHEVALGTGFADQSHLTRHFKRLVGVTPGEFRRRGKNVQ